MESAAVLRSIHCSVGITHLKCSFEKPSVIPMCNATFNKSSLAKGLPGVGRFSFSSVAGKRAVLPCLRASETILTGNDSSSQVPLEKTNIQSATFPNGFEALILEVCDETDVAELKLKAGNFEMNLRRNIEATQSYTPVVSHSTPPPAASKPVESATSLPPSPSKPSEVTSPYKNASLPRSSRLVALEASGATGYVLVSSPTVGSFRRGRTVKGKKLAPTCKEGDIIKEGQVIGFADQFDTQIPVKTDVAGEVLKFLHDEGEPIGYGDPLIAVLPSFHPID